MKILVLSKRVYTGKDLIKERYGRVYELSRAVASQGHTVRGVALDYRRKSPKYISDRIDEPNLLWSSMAMFPNPATGLVRYLRAIADIAGQFRPDMVLSVSDVYHVIAGDWLARRAGLTHVVDLYDDYMSFGAAGFPGVAGQYRRALARADGIVCVSNPLARHVQDTLRTRADPCVLSNAVDTRLFSRKDRTACRLRIGLAEGKILVGLGGDISRKRGIEVVLNAHRELVQVNHDIHLVLAGPRDKGMEIPGGGNIHYLGELAYSDMPFFYGALNVGIIANRASAFGRYCFPQKFFEMLACATPMVVAGTGEVTDLMQDCGHALFRPGDGSGLAAAIEHQLRTPCLPDVKVRTWEGQGAALSGYLVKVAGRAPMDRPQGQ